MRHSLPNEERLNLAGQTLAEARILNRIHGIPILVEGKRDVETLRALGFTGPLEQIHRGKPLDTVLITMVELYAKQQSDIGFCLYLLMDWDRTGGRLQHQFRRNFESLDFKFDESLRTTLMKYLFSITTTVEGLIGFQDQLLQSMDDYDPQHHSNSKA
ncbi:MAG: hypothetical protein O2866_00340 [archaeon]|nr:hypothetical protein [archaeon]MDA1167314.1 hypothetical protein [archaeon]